MSNPPRSLARLGSARRGVDAILVHGLERARDAQEQDHEPPLREAGVVDEVGVDGVLQVAAPIVRQDDVHRLASGIRLVARVDDLVVQRADDVRVRREEGVGFALAQRQRDRFLPERAPDLLERV